MKLVMWLLLGLIVYLALRSHARRNRARFRDNLRDAAQAAAQAAKTNGPASPSFNSSAPIENMVACAHCKIYLPISEATTSGTDCYFCCEEHAKLHSPITKNSPSQPVE